MRSIYSVGVRLGQGGVGTTARHAVNGLWRAGFLSKLIVNSYYRVPLPRQAVHSMGWVGRAIKKIAFYERSGRATDLTDAIFDAWAAPQVTACDVFHGWGNMSLRQIRRAHQNGAFTIVERASAHNLTQARLLAEEAQRWNIRQPLTVQRAIRRAAAETAETDFITVPSEFAYRSFIENGVAFDKLILIPFGVDVQRFAPPAELTRQKFHVVFIGLISVQKGVPDLLEAWRLAALPNAELSLAGVIGPEMPPILARYQDLSNLHLLGYVPDQAALLQTADVFVLPSIQEGSALVTYEAMASGLPVIITKNCGSIARNGQDGFIVPIRDPGTLANRLTAFAREPALRRSMGQAARRHVLDFSWERYGERLVEAYTRIQHGEKPDGPEWIFQGAVL
jgi:glycosyltransferase involved in cell wall biosynthesis